MKKTFALILLFALSVSLVACGGSAPATEEKVRDLPEGNYEEIGEGTTYLTTPSGTSEDGNIPVIYAEKSLEEMQIGLNAWDFNGSALSYVYVDGFLVDKEQLADTQTTLLLTPEYFTVGIHTVEVVQYENDDPTASMITYRTMQYEIKAA